MKIRKLALVFLGIVSAAVAMGCGPDESSQATVTPSAPEANANFTPPNKEVLTKTEEMSLEAQKAVKKNQKPGATAAPGATLPKPGEQVAVIETNYGRIVLKFFPKKAPGHVKNFVTLANKKFYDGTKFHRVIPGFMIQGGDPNSKTGQGRVGMGGPGYSIPAEFNDIHHSRGILSMARSSDPNSAGSQFFITVGDAASLDNQYTVFGQVVEGMDVADKIVSLPRDANDMPTPDEAVMKSVRIATWPLKK